MKYYRQLLLVVKKFEGEISSEIEDCLGRERSVELGKVCEFCGGLRVKMDLVYCFANKKKVDANFME